MSRVGLTDAPPRIRQIVADVLVSYREDGVVLTEQDIVGDARLRYIAIVRWEIWWKIRHLRTRWGEPFSYPQIGVWFNRDHTTIRHGVLRYDGVILGTAKRPYVRRAKPHLRLVMSS